MMLEEPRGAQAPRGSVACAAPVPGQPPPSSGYCCAVSRRQSLTLPSPTASSAVSATSTRPGAAERAVFGEAFAQGVLPANHLDTGGGTWTGHVNRYVAIGGDLRYDAPVTEVSGRPSSSDFALQRSPASYLYRCRSPIPDRLLLYVDDRLPRTGRSTARPGGMFWSANHSWYVKAGQMYCRSGWRLAGPERLRPAGHRHRHDDPDRGRGVRLAEGPLGCSAQL